MADTTVPITAGTGTPIRVLSGLGAGSGDEQVMAVADQYGNMASRVYGPLKVSQEEQTLFLDTHDQTLDTTNRWVTPTGANAPSVSSSVLAFGVATTASAFGKLPSSPSFSPQIPGFLQPSFSLKLDAAGAAAISGHRFWGVGTSPTTPATTTVATQLTDAIGFEVATDGKMYAVVYAGGSRTAIDLSASGTGAAASTQPLDGAYHRYLIQIRTDRIFWFIDSTSFYVATMSFTTPNTQTLPLLLQTINPAASVAAGGYPLSIQGSVVADTASNSSQLSDGTYPWRKAKVGASGDLVVSISNPNSLAAGMYATLSPTGTLNVSTDAMLLFADTFEGAAVDTGSRWFAAGTVPATQTAGSLSVNPSTTASATSSIFSQPSFTHASPISYGAVITIEAAVTLGNHRFWGLGTSTGVGTSAAPLLDAMGFEVDTAGALRASVYTNGTRTYSTVLTRPTDGASHRYSMISRGDIVFWYMDSFDVPAATTQITPGAQTLPLRFASLNSGSVTVGTPTMTVIGAALYDIGRNATGMADGLYPWRKVKVTAQGEQRVGTGAPAVVQKQSAVSTGSVSTLTAAYPMSNTQGNTLVVCIGVGNVTSPTVADSQGNTYVLAAATSLTGEGTAMYYAVNCRPGANTVTATNAGATASMAMEVYEVTNVYADAPVDITISLTGTSTTPGVVVTPASATNLKWSNTLVIECIGVGTAAQTVTVPALFTNDSGQLNPTTPAGLFSFVSVSRQMAGFTTVAAGSMTSEPWSAILVAFRPAPVVIDGSVRIGDGTQNAMVKASSTAAVAADTALVVAVSPNNTVPVSMAVPATVPAVGTTGDSSPKTVTGNGVTQTQTTGKGVWVTFNIGTVTGTTPTMVCKLQTSLDAGTTWVDIPGATTASLTATGVYGILVYPGVAVTAGTATTGTTATASAAIGRTWRVVYTLGGTSPSFTLTAVNTQLLT